MLQDKDFVLHVGLHRTGTTFLQTKYFPKLSSYNYIPQEKIYRELIEMTTSDSYLWNNTGIKERVVKCLDELSSSEKVNIISAEALSGFPFLKSINRTLIFERLKSLFPKAKIILGIREQKQLIKSLYFLYLREGGVLKLNELLKTSDKNFFGYTIYDNLIETIDLDAYKYNLLINQLFNCFGKSNTHIFLLENLKSDLNALHELNRFLNVDVDIDTHNKVNKTFPYDTLKAIRKLNVLTRGFKSKGIIRQFQKSKINKLIAKFYNNNSDSALNLDIDFFEYYKQDNQQLIEVLPQYKHVITEFNRN